MNIYANSSKLTDLKQKANRLPKTPGVYIMKNQKGEIIYIGKAKALKNRVTQYFGAGNQHTEKVQKMVSHVEDFDYILCDSEFEALILENSLIKQHQPKYNILLKDDKGYSYIKITKEKWPKISAVKQTDRYNEFLGPFNSGYVVKQTVDEAKKIFKLPDCNRDFDKITRPCLNYHIGICLAPCRGKISHDTYLEAVNSAKDFIKSGDSKSISLDALEEKMQLCAENIDFEQAARLRDRINAIKKLRDRQKVVSISHKDQDVIATAFLGEKACTELLIFRNFKLTDKKHYILEGFTDKSALYGEFLPRYYSENFVPPRILLDTDTEDFTATEEWLCQKTERKVSLINPKAGEPLRLMEMCLNNAAENLSQQTGHTGKEMSALNELGQLLGLEKAPQYIESYDISNTAGSDNVAGMVVFKDARPFKAAYKRFKIKGFLGQDDYRSMAEVLDRRFSEYKKGTDQGFATLPDLILLDGAKGQISAVLPVMEKHGLNIPVFGMVKDSKHRTRAIATAGGDIAIKSNRKAFTLVTNIQDEVHRFAISYHKKLQSKSVTSTQLLEIEGIGNAKAKALLRHFGSIKKIKSATKEQLSEVSGITPKTAESIIKYFAQ